MLVSIAFPAPMEPAKSILFILLDGMAPKSHGLYEKYCVDFNYESSDSWGKTGLAKFLQEEVTNSKAQIYSRPYFNPSESPSEMVDELSKNMDAWYTTNCDSYDASYDASKGQISYLNSGSKAKVGSIMDEALEHWFKEMLNESNLPKLDSNSAKNIMEKTQIRRNAWKWNSTNESFDPETTINASYANMDGRLHDWITGYKSKNGRVPTLEELEKERPDLVPSRYVFISKGTGGMVAREYVQGEKYRGDVDKILFFDTPHEGSGFADQAILSKDDLTNVHSELGAVLAAAVPLVSVAFIMADGVTQENLLEVTQTLIDGLSGLVNIGVYDGLKKEYFNDYEFDDGVLWYLAQDADKRDEKYKPSINKLPGGDVDTLIGRVQLLNSYDMITTYDKPMFRLTYSYGMPSIGNGRRMRADYLFQKKYHINKSTLNAIIVKQATNVVKTIMIDSAKIDTIIASKISDNLSKVLTGITDKLLSSPDFNSMWQFENQNFKENSDILKGIDGLSGKVKNLIQDNMNDWVKKGVKAGVEWASEQVLGFVFDKIDLGETIDDLPQWLVDFIAVAENFLPSPLQDDIVSTFATSYSPKYDGMKLASDNCASGLSLSNPLTYGNVTNLVGKDYTEDCTYSGQKKLAQNLIQYSINFFDQGTYDVSANSSYGGSVTLFSNSDISRREFPLHVNSNMDSYYASYKSGLVEIGAVTSNRELVDEVLAATCFGLKFVPAYGPALEKVCQAARLGTNMAFMADIASESVKLNNRLSALRASDLMAIKASLVKDAGGFTGMDSMLYENPYISLQSVVDSSVDGVRMLPMVFYATSGDGQAVPEISNFAQLKTVFASRFGMVEDSLNPSKIYPYVDAIDSYRDNKLKTLNDYRALSIKSLNYENVENDKVVRRVSYKNLPAMTVTDELQEYRFQIDDLRPDLIEEIKIDFNTDVQFYFTRSMAGMWTIEIARAGGTKKSVDHTYRPIVDANGLFVFRPKAIVEKFNEGKAESEIIAFNKVQQEGPNTVTITLSNNLGLNGYSQFSFYYQSTLPYLQEGFPKDLQIVSNLNEIFFNASNLGDPYDFTEGTLSVLKVTNNGFQDAVTNLKSTVQLSTDSLSEVIKDSLGNEKEVWEQKWKISNSLGENFLTNNNLSDGEYVLHWKLKTKNRNSSQTTEYSMRVRVYVDTKAPDISLVLSQSDLSGSDRDGVWGLVDNRADASALRAIRGFVVHEGRDTVFLFHNYGIGSTMYDFDWNGKGDSLPHGKATVYVQAVDFAVPSYDMIAVLDSFVIGDTVALRKSWKNILGSKGAFKAHINGKTVSKEIYIDKKKPELNMASVVVSGVSDTTFRTVSGIPAWSRTQGSIPVFNDAELVKISFALKEIDANKLDDSVRIQILFMDVGHSISKSYVRDFDFKKSATFEFTEPEAQQLPDGNYVVSVVMVDAAGNKTEVIDLSKKVKVDRTAPSVNQVVAGEPVYASASDVDSSNVYVSQPSDVEENHSLITCYQRITDGSTSSGWTNISSVSVAGSSIVRIPYSMKKSGVTFGDGQYATQVGCFDEAGNFSMNSDAFSVGHRYPTIVYPSSETAPITGNMVQIKGIAPDPIVPNGNLQTAEYKIEWKNTDSLSSGWHEDGIISMNKLMSSLVTTLAVWNIDTLPRGNYEIRLSVRGCRDASDSKCDWVSSTVPVTLDTVGTAPVNNPVISLSLPSSQVPGDSAHVISAYLNGANGSKDWSMQMKIYVADPFDTTKLVEATSAYADTMKVSPFDGVPSDFSDEGLYVYNDNGEWNVRYIGDVKAAGVYDTTALVLKYDHSDLVWKESGTIVNEKFYNVNDSTIYAPSTDLKYFAIPSYNYMAGWVLAEKSNDLHLKFKTAAPFIVDMSSADTTLLNHIYCGAKKFNYNDLDSNLRYVQTVYVDLNTYKLDVVWNGLTKNNVYPGSSKVKLTAVATENIENGRVIYAEGDWDLHFGETRVISNYGVAPDTLGEFVISRDSSASAMIKLGDIGYEFGITGRNAKVSVFVKDDAGKVVSTLMKDSNCIAGEQKDAYSVSWNGITDGGFAATNSGRYTFEVSAVDADGNRSSGSYPFVLTYAGQLLPAPDSLSGTGGVFAALSMDEALSDENGELRYVGKPDYKLTVDAKAQKLPEEERELEYYWDYTGTQEPSIYRANRFSLGIRRARCSFPVTVVTMISTYGYHMNFECRGFMCYKSGYYPEKSRYYFTVSAQRMTFDKLKNGGASVINSVKLNGVGKNNLVGFDANGDKEYDIGLFVKVFSATDYEDILDSINKKGHDFVIDADAINPTWNTLFKNGNIDGSTQYTNSQLSDFFGSDYKKTLLWSAKTTFKYKSKDMTGIVGEKDGTNETCVPSKENDYVCDSTDATYDAHKNMLTMDVLHVDGEKYFGNNSLDLNGSSNNDGSATSVFAKLKLTVKGKYWNPDGFGYTNLANKYTRFDHTNNTLYKKSNFFDACASMLNLHNGKEWVHSSNYGLVTAFETQKFAVQKDDCFKNNPLTFPDEANDETITLTDGASHYFVKFFGENTDADVTFQANMAVYGVDGVTKTKSFKSSNGDIQTFDGMADCSMKRDGFVVMVAPYITDLNATKPSGVQVSYPYLDSKDWIGTGVSNLCDDSSIRDVDNQSLWCYKAYTAASRIHYSVNDWTDADWKAKFTVGGVMKNMLTSLASQDSLFNRWNPTNSAGLGKFIVRADSTNYTKNVGWIIPRSMFEKTEKSSSWDGNIHPNPLLKFLDSKSWQMSDDGSYAYNPGENISEALSYIRSIDSVPMAYNDVKFKAVDTVSRDRLLRQNLSSEILGSPWVQEDTLINPAIYSRKADTTNILPSHPYFDVLIKNNHVQVTRNSLVPDARVDEIVTLRGRVPGVDLPWNLSYLYDGRIVPLKRGYQDTIPLVEPYPAIDTVNVYRLQGNTSFFLTYGSGNSNGDIYFKQLNVHIGQLVNPGRDTLIQSMYGNVSVQFPANAYDGPTDVTVRTASLSDFRYRIFEGLEPIGVVVEVLPSHKFDEDSSAKWPRVSVDITKETLGNKNPLEARIYKPDTVSKTIVPLDAQEISFYNGDTFLKTCGDSSSVTTCSAAPSGWDRIHISGKTRSFSTFIVMDTTVAANVHVRDSVEAIPEFACADSMPVNSIVWMGLVNGYLEYPYPCVGRSNYLLQLKADGSVAGEVQGVADGAIIWSARMNDIGAVGDTMSSRLALYGTNGKNVQLAGPRVLADTSLPKITEVTTSISDDGDHKQVTLGALLEDVGSGVEKTTITLYFGGAVLESRTVFASDHFTESFLITKEKTMECVGCVASFKIVSEDYGHNYVKTKISSEPIYPYPTTMVLWYPLNEGVGSVTKEITGSGIDLDISMDNPWRNGNSIYMWKGTDEASSKSTWSGVDTVPMSVEFAYKPGRYHDDRAYSLVSWNGSRPWTICVRNGLLSFDYMGHSVSFDKVALTAKVKAHYVLVAEGKTVSMYKNGILADQKDLGVDFEWVSRGNPVVGNNGKMIAMSGNMSSLRFYKDALSAEQVYSIYNGIVDTNVEIIYAHAVDLDDRFGMVVDQSCDLAGMAYLRQKNLSSDASVSWRVNVPADAYNMYVLSRGYANMSSTVDVLVDSSYVGSYSLSSNGIWETQSLEGLMMSLASGEHVITVKPKNMTNIAAFALVPIRANITSANMTWNDSTWLAPEAKVQVEMLYPAFGDKTWMKSDFRLKNLTGSTISGMRLRYYYSGEGIDVSAQSFNPQASVSFGTDGGDVYYVEYALTESVAGGASANWGYGPQIGIHRNDKYNSFPAWNYNDDPSFDSSAIGGSFQVTDRIALLDEDGYLLSNWSCYEQGAPAEMLTPSVRALAMEENWDTSAKSTIAMLVENTGVVKLDGFEVRYYFRDDAEKPQFDIHSNMLAQAPEYVEVGNGLYYVSFRYNDVILNPGEKSDFGNGVKFALHHTDYQNWNAADDPSHSGLTHEMSQADSIVVLDLSGQLLWGTIPQQSDGAPKKGPNTVVTNGAIEIDRDQVIVTVNEPAYYVLQVVDALGSPLQTLFKGSWNEGVHYVSVENTTLISNNFLVLTRNGNILNKVKLE